MARIVIETPCEHANHPTCVNIGVCEGTRRRVLDPGSYETVEWWDNWIRDLLWRHHGIQTTARHGAELLDALAGGEQP